MEDKMDDTWVLIDSKTEPTTFNKEDILPKTKSNLIKVVKIMDKLKPSSAAKSKQKQDLEVQK